MLNKNAQISIFVIISAVIVIVVGFFIYNQNYEIFYSPENQLASELRENVNSCVSSSTDLGVFLLGFQGGYIQIPQEVQTNPNRRLVFNDGEGEVSQNTLTIPNWDSQLGGVPTRESMEGDLEVFVKNNSRNCIESNLDAYTDYLNLDYSFEGENFSIDSTINDANIEVDVDFPLSFEETNGDIDSEISSYYVSLEDTRLGDLHSLAMEIYNVERDSQLFEKLVMDQIYSSGSSSSSDMSMPTEGMTFSCNPQIWTKSELKETLANLNNNNFNYLYFEGTRSIEDRFENNLDGEFENLRDYYQNTGSNRDISYTQSLQNTKDSYEEYNVDVMMPTSRYTGSTGYFNEYPYREFEVSPSDGEVVKAMDLEVDMGSNIPIPCMQIFHHLYTLDYDLMVQLNDYTDEGQENLLFQFPLRVEIEDNSPKESPDKGYELPEGNTATNERFCAQENRNTNATFYVQDQTNNEYLTGANVTYKCVGLTCDVGTTQRPTYGFEDLVRPDADPKIETQIGYCEGGVLEVEKEGYHQIDQNPQRITTNNNQEISPVTAVMVPTKEFDIDFSTLTATSYQTCDSFARNSGELFISVENQAMDFESSAYYPNDSDFMNSIELLEKPGVKYNISAVYLRDDEAYGILQLENKELNYNQGNNIKINMPTTQLPINENNAMNYFEDIEDVLDNNDVCPGVDFGINIQ